MWHLVSTVDGAAAAGRRRRRPAAGHLPAGLGDRRAEAARDRRRSPSSSAEPRGVYTGAIGFVSPCWGAEFAVAIRTFEITGDRVELGVGGGVTADSVPMLEWRECLHKAAPLLARPAAARAPLAPPAARTRTRSPAALLETMLAVDGVPLRLADHLARLDRSCRELYGRGLPGDLAARVAGGGRVGGAGRAVLRVVVGPDGQAT